VNNSTLFNNHATGGNGGAGGPGLGGGIYLAAGAVQVFQNTLSANQSMGASRGYLVDVR